MQKIERLHCGCARGTCRYEFSCFGIALERIDSPLVNGQANASKPGHANNGQPAEEGNASAARATKAQSRRRSQIRGPVRPACPALFEGAPSFRMGPSVTSRRRVRAPRQCLRPCSAGKSTLRRRRRRPLHTRCRPSSKSLNMSPSTQQLRTYSRPAQTPCR